MQIAPLSLIPKSSINSPDRILKHQDSLIFSITSQKFNSRKQTLLLDDSKQLKPDFMEMKKDSLELKQDTNDLHKYSIDFRSNFATKSNYKNQYDNYLDQKNLKSEQKQQAIVKNYFKIQDKIKSLQEKVQNIKTNYCQSQSKQSEPSHQLKQTNQKIIDLEFPEQIYRRNILIDIQNKDNNIYSQTVDDCEIIGKIKRKKPKYYTGCQSKNKQSKLMSKCNNESSTETTKRNCNTTYNHINDFLISKRKNSSQRKNSTSNKSIRSQTKNNSSQSRNNKSQQKQNYSYSNLNLNQPSSFINYQNSSSFKKSNKKQQTNNSFAQIKHLRQQLIKTKLSDQRNSRKSIESIRKLSQSKGQVKKLKNQMHKYKDQIEQLRRKLKKSQTVRQRQKQTIMSQKEQIGQLKRIMEQIVKKNQIDLSKIKGLRG